MASLVEIKKTFDKYNNLIKAIDFLSNNSVYVGIPEGDANRKEQEGNEGITNVELMFIHSKGSPVNNIPPRPSIEPAIEKDQERLGKMMDRVISYAENGEIEKARKQLSLVGMRGQNISMAWFTNNDNGWPPDKPKTIQRKKRKHKQKGYEPRTLIDTAQMRNAITYFIETHGGRGK